MFVKIIDNQYLKDVFSIKFYINDELYVIYLPNEIQADFRSSLKPISNNDDTCELIKDNYMELDDDSAMFNYLKPYIKQATLKMKGYKPCFRDVSGCMEMIPVGQLYCKPCSKELNENLKINRKLNERLKINSLK